MSYYKAEVMSVHNLTSEEYDSCVLDSPSIYHSQIGSLNPLHTRKG
jgi:hypothetical protein